MGPAAGELVLPAASMATTTNRRCDPIWAVRTMVDAPTMVMAGSSVAPPSRLSDTRYRSMPLPGSDPVQVMRTGTVLAGRPDGVTMETVGVVTVGGVESTTRRVTTVRHVPSAAGISLPTQAAPVPDGSAAT